MQEIEVLRQTKAFLHRKGLLGRNVLEIYTDSHPSLLGDRKLDPFQRFTLQFDAFAVHPDLVGRLDDGETLFAVEAKGSDDWLKGIAQADVYRQGFHASMLAVAGTPSADVRAFARQRGIGILAVLPHGVDLIDPPPLSLPKFVLAKSILSQFSATNTLLSQFSFNLPTHYLGCAICLDAWQKQHSASMVSIQDLESFVRNHYPVMPKVFRPALAGAAKLRLINIYGNEVELTKIGKTCMPLLPDAATLNTWHSQAIHKPLAVISPSTGAVLRILLEGDPVAKFITDVLEKTDPREAIPMSTLVEIASRLDKTMTPIVFFFPKIVHEILDDQGFIVWHKVEPRHYRTSIYMQYKKILIHAGFIADHGVGGTSSKSYNPDRDIWEYIL
ncbi:hypothetical protein [Candidatus Viridilinea mediisalina]|uniref:Uncharacterized protein n=1 Tax=Candidatus Viridilinea mediisalina TaxID=2024553 RepID=A0A2A6RD76_9CHLR|nr:hypothetical protein [Candidatus Viridilinea mediisalina]PDW00056.1 hypothetical protein CJ255_21190 [Candidatus Viridilinea mediisalina]